MFAVRCGRNLLALAVVVLAGVALVPSPASAQLAPVSPTIVSLHNQFVDEGEVPLRTYSANMNVTRGDAREVPECGYTVRWRTVDGSAKAGSDFDEVSNGLVLVPPRAPNYTLPIKIRGDTVRELWEKFYIDVTVPAACGSSLTVTKRMDVRIWDDDEGPALFAGKQYAPGQAVREVDPGQGTVNASFEIRRDGPADGLATAKWRTADGTAKAGSDYAERSGTVAFAAGETTKAVTVPILHDLVKEEPSETFSVKLSDPTGAVILNDVAPATISDNDQLQGLRINNVQVTEGQSGTRLATFQVSRLGVNGTQASVRWSTGDVAPPPPASPSGWGVAVRTPYEGGQASSNRPATAGEDYSPVTSQLLTFAPGETVKNVSVTILGDTVPEPDENLWVTLSSPSGVSILPDGAVGGAKIVTDDTGFWVNDLEVEEDPLDVPLSYDPFDGWGAPVAEPESPSFTIWRTGPLNNWSQVNWDLYNGTATAFYDFVGDFGTVYFAPGETSRIIPLKIRRDQLPEGDEQFTVRLSESIGSGIAKDTGVVRIQDDDGFVIDDVTVTETSAGTSLANFGIRLTGPATIATSVKWATADTGTLRTDATAGVDYRADSGTVSFAAGETKKTVSVVINGDTTSEQGEQFSVSLSAAQGADVVDGIAIGTILNAAQGLKVDDASVTEGNAGTKQLTFEVNRVGSATGAASAKWSTVTPSTSGSGAQIAYRAVSSPYETIAASPATPGSDYTAVTSGTVSFAADQRKATISVSVHGDTTVEDHERLEVRLASPVGTSIVDGTGLGSILTDDSSTSVIERTIREGLKSPHSEVVTIARAGTALEATTVNWVAKPGSAASPSDFTAASGSVDFASGQTSRKFPVTISGDRTPEPDETFTVTLSTPGGVQLGTGTVKIANDDGLTVDDVPVLEPQTGTTTATFTIGLSGPATTPVSVNWATNTSYPSGTSPATAGIDYTAVAPRRVDFAVGETSKQVSVTVRSDIKGEPLEAFSVALSSASGAAILDPLAHGRIVNYKPGVFINNVSLPEGDSGSTQAQFTLTRAGDVSQPASVTATPSNDTAGAGATEFAYDYVYWSFPAMPGATGGSDYTIDPPTTVTFAAGQRTKTVPVTVHGDANLEFSETFFVNLSNAAGTTIADNRGVGLIVNDD